MKPAVLVAEPEPLAAPAVSPAAVTHTLFSDLCELVKARLTTLVLTTTLAGFYLGWQGPMNYLALFNALFGTALVAGGAAALNELIERDADANMRRTRDRPLPSGRMQPDAALLIGFALAAGGLLYLLLLANPLSSMLAAVTLTSYLFAYTPLKRVTTLNTLVGGIPGALPPVIGWAAACGTVDIQAGALFGILFCWQMPHFLAIAWMYRDEYAGAGFVMLPNTDEDGASTGRQAVNYSGALLLVSLLPSILGLESSAYFFGAFVLGAGMLYFAWQLQLVRSRPRARRLFFASIIYLPLLLALLALCKRSI